MSKEGGSKDIDQLTFTAIDFETAEWNPASICQIGLVRIENGEITDQYNRLVRPPNNHYFYKNIEVHGIRPEDTEYSASFDDIWHEWLPWIKDEVVVAHNSKFDFRCLDATLDWYDLEKPFYEGRCTFKIYRRGLAYLCKKHKITLKHHDALSDARACALLYLKHLAHLRLPKTGSLFD